MVDGYSRVTNGHRIGVFMMQNGPGAENGFGGVAQAYAESVPILLLPAGMARQRAAASTPIFTQRVVMSQSRNGAPKSTWSNGCRSSAAGICQAAEWPPGTGAAGNPARCGPGGVPCRVGSALRHACARRIGAVEQAAQALLTAQCPILHAGQACSTRKRPTNWSARGVLTSARHDHPAREECLP